jgi:endonuclease/exonuclease/phosphatase (EEP) superfamily protein YafD
LAAVVLVAHLLIPGLRGVAETVSAGLCAVVCLYQGAWIWSFTPLHRREVAKAGPIASGQQVRMLTANVLMTNRNADALLDLINRSQPDLVLTLETNHWWQQQLAAVEIELPHTLSAPLENLYGMHLYSRWPLADPKIQFLVEPDKPSMHTCVVLPDGQCLRLICLHPAPPSPRS